MAEISLYRAPPAANVRGDGQFRFPRPRGLGRAPVFGPPLLDITLPNQSFSVQADAEIPALLANRVTEITLERGGTINLTA